MKEICLLRRLIWGTLYGAAVLLLWLLYVPRAQANVYATNIRLNGGLTNVVLSGSVTISYILNEPASAGLILEIKSGLNTLRTFIFTNDQPGALRGTNVVVWNGLDNASNAVPNGTYSIQITARSTGYGEWKQLTDNANVGNTVFEARGIAVNQNPASPYYGRVFVGNALQGPNTNANPGDRVGVLKLNADGSPAGEGIFSAGGWPWSGEYVSPWKLEVGQDDRVYVNDWISSGVVLSFDPTISAASRRVVLRDDNWPNAGAVNLGGLFVSGTGDDAKIWMADITSPGVGIRRWSMTNGIVATNDLGVTAVASGAGSDLNLYPWDVALDASNRLYVIQYETELTSSPADHLLSFPPYPELGPAQTVATWKTNFGADTLGAHGVAVDPTGTFVAVAFQRLLQGGGFQNGAVKIFYATNGSLADIPTDNSPQDYRDVAWDNVGNLYVIDNFDATWKAFSPPSGSNQNVTVSTMTVTVGPTGPVRPLLSDPWYTNGLFTCYLTGEPNVVYYLEATTNLTTWQLVATNSSALAKRQITIAAPNSRSFYRAYAGAAAAGPVRPTLSSPSYGAGQFNFTLQGEAGVSYIIQRSADLLSWSSILTNASGGATRQINVPASGARNFYRAWRAP